MIQYHRETTAPMRLGHLVSNECLNGKEEQVKVHIGDLEKSGKPYLSEIILVLTAQDRLD